ncbi:MAG: terminase small subunit [Acidobacteriia bacterium]|nr:terminase small subunit [Terriglobia bacterium]
MGHGRSALFPEVRLPRRQLRFCEEYIVDHNAEAAAKRAGYSEKSARWMGYKLLKHYAGVRDYVAQLDAELAERTKITAELVRQRLREIAEADWRRAYGPDGQLLPPNEIPDDVARAIGGIKTTERYVGAGESRDMVLVTKNVDFLDRLRAWEMLGRSVGLFLDRTQHEAGKTLEEVLRSLAGPRE